MIPYNPIAGGMLSGKHDRSKPPDEGTRFTLGNAATTYQDRYWHDNVFDTVDELAKIADRAGHAAADARGRVGARAPGDHLADRRREPPRAARRDVRRARHAARRRRSKRSSTSSPPNGGEATRRGDAPTRRSQPGASSRRRAGDRPHHGRGRPYASLLLADFGADVIKIEAPRGDLARDLGPRCTTTWARCTSTSTAGNAASCSTSPLTTVDVCEAPRRHRRRVPAQHASRRRGSCAARARAPCATLIPSSCTAR